MARSIIDQQKEMEAFSDDMLMQEATQPSGMYPQYLTITEITRRKDLRDRFAAAQQKSAANQPTVLENRVADLQSGGIGALPLPQAPAAPGMTAGVASIPPQGLAHGGEIGGYPGGDPVQGYAHGGPIEGYPKGGYVDQYAHGGSIEGYLGGGYYGAHGGPIEGYNYGGGINAHRGAYMGNYAHGGPIEGYANGGPDDPDWLRRYRERLQQKGTFNLMDLLPQLSADDPSEIYSPYSPYGSAVGLPAMPEDVVLSRGDPVLDGKALGPAGPAKLEDAVLGGLREEIGGPAGFSTADFLGSIEDQWEPAREAQRELMGAFGSGSEEELALMEAAQQRGAERSAQASGIASLYRGRIDEEPAELEGELREAMLTPEQMDSRKRSLALSALGAAIGGSTNLGSVAEALGSSTREVMAEGDRMRNTNLNLMREIGSLERSREDRNFEANIAAFEADGASTDAAFEAAATVAQVGATISARAQNIEELGVQIEVGRAGAMSDAEVRQMEAQVDVQIAGMNAAIRQALSSIPAGVDIQKYAESLRLTLADTTDPTLRSLYEQMLQSALGAMQQSLGLGASQGIPESGSVDSVPSLF